MAYEIYRALDDNLRLQITTYLRQLAALIAAGGSGRELLIADRIYYVRTDGSDSNTGLVNTAGGAFLTIQHALYVIYSGVDFGANKITIQVGDGTYTGAFTIEGLVFGGRLEILGNTGTPANCIISTTLDAITALTAGTSVYISGFKVSSSAGSGILAEQGSMIELGAVDFGACTSGYHIRARGGFVSRYGSIEVSGGALSHVGAEDGGIIIGVSGYSVTLTGTPAFGGAFAYAIDGSLINDSMTYVGGATGPRFLVSRNAAIDVHGAGINYYPGNSAGTSVYGGQYDVNATTADTVTTNANLTGHVTSVGNAAVLGSFTKAQLTTAVSDGDPLYVGDVTTNATHTGEVTGSGALTVDPTAISNRSTVTVAPTDTILIGDASDSNLLKKIVASDFATAAQANATHTGEVTGATVLTVDKTAITNRSTTALAPTDKLLFSDVSNSDALAKAVAHAIGRIYRPALMQYASSAYYSRTYTSAGNKVTMLCRFRLASFTGGAQQVLMVSRTSGNRSRFQLTIYASDHATTTRRNKVQMYCEASGGGTIASIWSSVDVADGNLHTLFCAYDGDGGTAIMYVDGVDVKDTGNVAHTLTTGTLGTGATTSLFVGAIYTPASYFIGQLGFVGHREAYLTNYSDFMDTDGSPKTLYEDAWTQWGAQPQFFNPHGQMDNNKGSAGVLTKTGTILVSFEEFELSTGLVV